MLTDGQTLRVIIEGEKVPSAVAVPQAAIAQDQSGAFLFVVNDKNVVEQKRVRTGVSRDGMIAITSGLQAGERVIVQGQQRVRPGMTVNPSAAPPPASTQKR
jgi:membrane fusion protein (multidrug efflux system)